MWRYGFQGADRSLVPALGWSVVPALRGSLVPAYVPQITAGPHFGPPPAKTQTCHLCPPFGLKIWQGHRMRCLSVEKSRPCHIRQALCPCHLSPHSSGRSFLRLPVSFSRQGWAGSNIMSIAIKTCTHQCHPILYETPRDLGQKSLGNVLRRFRV